MAHPATRILTVLELLQTHARLSGTELASRLDVDGRTLRRYIRTLEDIGVPITTERGRHGAYMLVAGFKLPPMMFTDDEALALSLGLLAARGLGLADAAPAVASAQAKLERVMPANLRRRVRAIDETVTLDFSKPIAPGDNAALVALSSAAQSRLQVELDYRSATSDATTRVFDAYGLAWRGGRWYVVGHCHLRGGLRSFRLDRVQQVRELDTPFERPASFDAAAQLAFGIATMPREIAVEVVLHADAPTAMGHLPEGLGVFEPHADTTTLRSRTDSLQWFARLLLNLPFAFDVVAPQELHDAVVAHAEAVLARMRGTAARRKPKKT
jgi:predicted DNA-binding transcriptional regulator YafY